MLYFYAEIDLLLCRVLENKTHCYSSPDTTIGSQEEAEEVCAAETRGNRWKTYLVQLDTQAEVDALAAVLGGG